MGVGCRANFEEGCKAGEGKKKEIRATYGREKKDEVEVVVTYEPPPGPEPQSAAAEAQVPLNLADNPGFGLRVRMTLIGKKRSRFGWTRIFNAQR